MYWPLGKCTVSKSSIGLNYTLDTSYSPSTLVFIHLLAKKRRLEDQMYMQKVDKTKEKIEALTRQREAEEKSKSVQAKAPKAAQAQTEVHTAGDDWRNEYDDIVLDDMRDILVQEDQRAADNDNVDEDIVQALNPDLAMEDNYIMSTDREL